MSVFISSCISSNKEDVLEFGKKNNSTRKIFNTPLIQNNMVANKCCKDYPVYEIEKIPTENKAYHYSKSIISIQNHKIHIEKDIYRKSVNDTTLIQLNIYSKYDWSINKATIIGDLFLIDKRYLKLSSGEMLKESSKYPEHEKKKLNLTQTDSVLKNWKLSLLDK